MKDFLLVRTWCRGWLLIAMMCLVSGCMTTRVVPYEDHKRLPLSTETPVPILDIGRINEPYTVIGYVEIKASELYSAETIMAKMRRKARRLGGDALSDFNQYPVKKKFPRLLDYLNFYGNVWSAEIISRDENCILK